MTKLTKRKKNYQQLYFLNGKTEKNRWNSWAFFFLEELKIGTENIIFLYESQPTIMIFMF